MADKVMIAGTDPFRNALQLFDNMDLFISAGTMSNGVLLFSSCLANLIPLHQPLTQLYMCPSLLPTSLKQSHRNHPAGVGDLPPLHSSSDTSQQKLDHSFCKGCLKDMVEKPVGGRKSDGEYAYCLRLASNNAMV